MSYIYIMNVKRLTCRLGCCLRNCNRSHLLVNALTCFHCHDHYCVHSKTKTAYIYIYISATVSVRHFNRADSLCSHTLRHHDPDKGCFKHRNHNIHLDRSKTFEQIIPPAAALLCVHRYTTIMTGVAYFKNQRI